MSDPFEFVTYTAPARVANLGFRIAVPKDWAMPELPAENADFNTPTIFLPLMLAVAPYAAIVLTVAARPAYGDGSVQDWTLYLLGAHGIEPASLSARPVGGFKAIAGLGRQVQDGVALETRFAFFEDGGRLVNLTLMAPAALSSPLEHVWQAALESFELAEPIGQSAPLHGIAHLPEPAAPEPSFAAFALAAGAESLDPDEAMNANLRDRGVGLTPKIVSQAPEEKKATIGAGAIVALIDVPFGWHVIDDGRRMLIFEPSGKIQVNLNLIESTGGPEPILGQIEAEARQSYIDQNPQFLRLSDGPVHGLGIRNILADGEAVEQIHLLTPGREGQWLRARVTATPDSITSAANLAELILKSAVFDPGAGQAREPAADAEPKPDGPEWWRKAVALERQNRLEEAEQTIHEAVPHLGSAITTADLYRSRWLRLTREGDTEGAHLARRKASDWAYFYASLATSGGEGAALSRERDEFLATLGPDAEAGIQ